MSRQPGDFPPDKGRGRVGQSRSSCSGDTCGPTRCLGAGHSEQSRGRRSFRCTAYPSSLRSKCNALEKCTGFSKMIKEMILKNTIILQNDRTVVKMSGLIAGNGHD